MFISFEGLDSSGKSTQVKLLEDRLKKMAYPCILLREPGGTAISEQVRDILLDRVNTSMSMKAELFLFCAARTQLVTEIILPALRRGEMVICDRFHDSTTAYQGYGRGLDLNEIEQIHVITTGGTFPDLTLLIDVDMDELVRRRVAAGLSADRMESAGRTFFDNVRRGYLAIAAREPKRVVLIDGMQDAGLIHEQIWDEISTRLKQSSK